MSHAWLVLAAGGERQHQGNDGYDDDPAVHYSWDDTVSNHARPAIGDAIVLWDGDWLIGISVIDGIIEGDARKKRFRCPGCGSTGFKSRRTRLPLFRCDKCRREFDSAVEELIDVHTYRTSHAAAWLPLRGLVSGSHLRDMCVERKSIQSIRELRWPVLAEHLLARKRRGTIAVVEAAMMRTEAKGRNPIARISATLRVTADQPFDDDPCCAITGLQPSAVLESVAMKLYDGAEDARQLGFLTLRRDLVPLLDRGLLSVNPKTLGLDVHSDLFPFGDYWLLRSKTLDRPRGTDVGLWLDAHWLLHRSSLQH